MNVKEISLPIPKNGEPMTNEEWLKQCNTEQLAEWICSVHEKCYYCGAKRISDRERCPFGDGKCRNNKHEFAMWLKQPHSRGVTEIDMRAK